MKRSELISFIPTIITSVHSIEDHGVFFNVVVSGCLFPDELDELRKYCRISDISYSAFFEALVISCYEFDN